MFKGSDNTDGIMAVGSIDISADKVERTVNYDDLPIIPTRNLVLFPGVTIPISLGRQNSEVTCELAANNHISIGIVCQKDPNVELPTVGRDLLKYGVVADVIKVLTLPNDTKTAIVMAREKFRILGRGEGKTMPQAELSARVKVVNDTMPPEKDEEFPAIIDNIKHVAGEIVEKSNELPKEMAFNVMNCENPYLLVNMVATHLVPDVEVKSTLLAQNRMKERAFKLLVELTANEEKMTLRQEIMDRARMTMEQNQRNAFLQQQMESIREELYGEDTYDVDRFEEVAAKMLLPKDVAAHVKKEIDKLRRLNPQSPDYAVQYSYLETLLDLPWVESTPLKNNFDEASNVLDSNHYGLEKVKERILEQLAVLMHNPKGKAPILCLVGPPGVGKTSLGQSVAQALGRKYQRVSLGGLHDEAEIRGHRRTYVGAMPGRIIDAIKRAKSSNPVLLLDEVDKIGADFKGDPAAALLEVLDPEQNCHFHDNYIDVDFDLSNVLFIATANTLNGVSQPLIDRMEVIDLSGYILEEKVQIASKHLWKQICTDHNIDCLDLISPEAIVAIIESYTSESGVRQLEKCLAKIARKFILAKISGKDFPEKVLPQHLKDLLGTPIYNKERYEGNDFAGVVTGLAWTKVGGEILLVESALSPGKGDRLTLTGNLGDVMKESANIALQWVKAHASTLGIDPSLFEKYNLHIHFPEGAIPKDGPSAGITMATSIVSMFTQRRVRDHVAMTGEITLRGKVLPVGGIKEKILAAKRAGITDIVLSEENRKDIDDIAEKYRNGLTFHYVSTVDEVIDFALLEEKVNNAISL